MPLLVGGRKSVRVSRISRGRVVGGRYEGTVRKVHVTLGRGARKRKILLAEKTFRSRRDMPRSARLTQPNLRSPLRQYRLMRKLMAINQRMGLNLPILKTI